ncbi:hypothetical protein MTO96_029815 [Rhipicephalus appendiculatus]
MFGTFRDRAAFLRTATATTYRVVPLEEIHNKTHLLRFVNSTCMVDVSPRATRTRDTNAQLFLRTERTRKQKKDATSSELFYKAAYGRPARARRRLTTSL